jgi:hypothetical protein
MPYRVGGKGTNGCKGYPVVKENGEVVGCHATRAEADNQLQALYANVPDAEKNKVAGANPSFTIEPRYPGAGVKRPSQGTAGNSTTGGNVRSIYAKKPKKNRRGTQNFMGDSDGAIATSGTSMGTKSMDDSPIKEGDYVMGMTTEGMTHGQVEHIMTEGGIYGVPGTEYAIQSMPPENPAMAVRVFEEEEDGMWEPTAYSIGMMYQDATRLDDLQGHHMEDQENESEMEMLAKADTYTPTAGMKSAAARAIRWKEQGKATGAGTPVGWGRARDIVSGRSMSISVVRRMYSFFSRHEVDKKGKDFNNTSNPSNGRIMWDAWGGDAGFSWSRSIVERMRDKALFADFGKYYRKSETMMDKAIGVGSMVSWNSSGGRASGKITRIIRNGSYNVPGTDVTISGTPDNPAAVIRLYRDGKPTDTIVSHRMNTLRAS